MARTTDEADGTIRNRLSEIFAIGGFVVIVVLGIVVILLHPDSAQSVLNAVLPLVASWIGTVIAYYFSKENLAAATSSVATLARGVVDAQRLESIPVKDRMISRANIVTLPPAMTNPWTNLDAVLLKDIVQFAAQPAKPITRIPILKPDDTIAYMIHVSVINQFIAKQAVLGATATTLTFKDLLADPQVHALATGSIATVSDSSTVAQAKVKMDQTPGCEDAFVTADGTATKPVLGWLTDDAIWAAARV